MWVILRESLLSTWTPFCIQTKTGKEVIYASFSNGKYLTDEKFFEPWLRLCKQTRECQKKEWLWTGLATCASGSGRACVSSLITHIIAPTPCSVPRRAALQSYVFKRKKRQHSNRALLERGRAATGAEKLGGLYAGDRGKSHRRKRWVGLIAQSKGRSSIDNAPGFSRKGFRKIKNQKHSSYLFFSFSGWEPWGGNGRYR